MKRAPIRGFNWSAVTRTRLTTLIAAGLAVSLIGGLVAWQGGPPKDRGQAEAPPQLSTGPSASPIIGSPPPAERTAIAKLDATDEAGGVVAVDSAFRLTSLDGSPAAELAKHLTVEPVVRLDVLPDGAGDTVLLVPREPLAAGAMYRFALKADDGRLLDSWAFQAHAGVRVVATLPGHEQTDVPLDTGIEITFDQDGVTGAEDHVTFDPPIEGRFEQHGRVLAFVPKALSPSTAYTVTVSPGISVATTGEESTQSATFRFETSGADPESGVWLRLQDDLIESSTSSRPALAFWVYRRTDDAKPPSKLPVEVYRLPTGDAAIDALQASRAWSWLRHSATGLTDPAGLTRVLKAELPVEPYGEAVWVGLPERLPAGWYLVRASGDRRPSQAVLQVTDLSAYLAVSDTRTVVWANDVASGAAVEGATVTREGETLGRTGPEGLLMADTPPALLSVDRGDCRADCDPILTVTTADGRGAILPASGAYDAFGYNEPYVWSEASPRYWTVFDTDRSLFRATDRIDAWGVLRNRDTDTVPDSALIRLVADTYDEGGAGPAIASIEVEPRDSGVFKGSIPISGMPIGYYRLELVVGSDVVTTRVIQVGQILKPAYRLEVDTGHRVYIAGDRVRVDVGAAFYDGTPAPGIPVRVTTDFLDETVTTDAAGAAVIRTTARVADYNTGEADHKVMSASPARAEEGEINGTSLDFVVFPSSRVIDGTSEISDGRVRVSGAVHEVDQERIEGEIRGGRSIWEVDPRGDAISRALVNVRFVERVPVRGAAHQEYDFLQKKVVTIYEYDIVEREAGTLTARTDANGRFTASIDAGDADGGYEVSISVADPDGRTAATTTYASRAVVDTPMPDSASLEVTGGDDEQDESYGVGDAIDLTFNGSTPSERDDRYLFFEAQRGVRSAIVQTSGRYTAPFEAADAPGVSVYGIRFTGSGYEATGHYVPFRVADRGLDVQLSTASRNLAPGDEVTVDISLRDDSGRPAAGTVVVRAVDEKLYTIGAAEELDVRQSLYESVTNGVRGTYRTHRLPGRYTGGGDTGGGGDDRFNFADALVFEVIETDASGHGSVSFKLSDDLTSWHVSAAAVTADLQAGNGALQLPVGLPFFVDPTIAPEYLTTDRPTIVVRTFGSALAAGDAVSVTAEAPSLGLKVGPLSGTAFGSIYVPLPELRPGRHEITIRATTGSGGSRLSDGVKRTFVVVDSRLTRGASAHVDVTGPTHLEGGTGLTTVVVSDAGASRHFQLLLDLAGRGGARLDSSLAAARATSLLVDRFGIPAGTLSPSDFSANRYQTPDGGLALLLYASSDLELSALAAIAGGAQFDRSRLQGYLQSMHDRRDASRERRVIALAGLAALGAPVLPELRAAAADPELTTRERLYAGIGLARAGDAATARAITDDLVGTYGEAVDGRIRLRVGSSADDIGAGTALAAVLAASVGDGRATALWAYVAENPPKETVFDLHAVAYVEATFDWLKIEPARFAWTLDGKRTVVDLAPGTASSFSLTADQLAGFTIERIDGAIGASATWREQAEPGDFRPDPDVTVTRRITPIGPIDAADFVTVQVFVTFARTAAIGCHEVIDHVPSGLVPVGSLARWIDPEGGEPTPETIFPYFQGSQLIRWCAEPILGRQTVELRYYARVITPGTYAWEPTVVESRAVQGRATLTKPATIAIR